MSVSLGLIEFVGRPEGKFFSWIDLGTAQIEYVDPVKLTARIDKLRVDQELPQLWRENLHLRCLQGMDLSRQMIHSVMCSAWIRILLQI